jgi:hypothetical protein
MGCSSGACDREGKSFALNFKESLQEEGINTEVKGYSEAISINDEGAVLQGKDAPKDRRMMKEGDFAGLFAFKEEGF